MIAAAPIAYVELDALDLGLAAVALVLNAGLSLAWRLGLGRRLALAAARATAQLLAVGLVLEWVFDLRHPLAVVALLGVMVSIAAITAHGRVERSIPGLRRVLGLTILASSMILTFYGALCVLHADRWYEPRVVVPVGGMLLGNTLTGVTLCVDRLLAALEAQRARIEALLAHGATPREALIDVRRDAARTGMIPILNSMLVAGVVALPGMMTGQILAGAPPLEAVSYQLAILFLIAGSTALGVLVSASALPRYLFAEDGRPAFERIRRRPPA